jgi:hypothetical protein
LGPGYYCCSSFFPACLEVATADDFVSVDTEMFTKELDGDMLLVGSLKSRFVLGERF